MKKCWIFIVLLLVLVMVPKASAADEDSMYSQIVSLVYGENMPELQMLEDRGAEILSLDLQQTPDTEIQYTYENGWMLTGTAEPGTWVGVVVYTLSEKNTPIIWYDHETVIGESGLYQEKVPLQILDLQYILVTVRDEDHYAGRVYSILRKSGKICSTLLEYELNLYEEYGLS